MNRGRVSRSRHAPEQLSASVRRERETRPLFTSSLSLQPFDVFDELTERLDTLGIIEFPEVDAEPVLEFAD